MLAAPRVAVLLAALACAPLGAGFTFTVSAGGVECFDEQAPLKEKVAGVWSVLHDVSLDIDVKVVSPSGDTIYDAEAESSGSFEFTSREEGAYQICYSNERTRTRPATISAKIAVGEPERKLVDEIAQAEHLSPLETRIKALEHSMNSITDLQKYMRGREKTHRQTTESTKRRVLWWSVFESVVLVAMSVWQVTYLRKFFEVKRIV
ncbi:emp24/gp25L/p24 family/GOLD-domain-containing protein [Pavlovales sp. CCMP2436]|nr:emp24/gp25L/p24 family/GOLD-domain-containing protein [Pavlovales sp. CCMP2436]|mmetsp:Transcript_36635/g.91355  ORF Transcript_36635/g.91355 Transcript_36635/m.91355 type:complete len:206 (-) Transcript_36635:97-714(-)